MVPSALVLELVEGETLADRIARGPIPLNEAMTMARQIADALEAAHEKGIIHRDLKPANIMITAAGVKVLDFGVSKRVEAVDDDGATQTLSWQTRAGEIVGTLSVSVAGAGRGQDGGCAIRHFFAGCRFLRDVLRKASIPRRHEVGATCKHSAGSPGTPWKTSARTSGGHRSNHPAMPGKTTRGPVRVSARTSSRIGSMSDAERAQNIAGRWSGGRPGTCDRVGRRRSAGVPSLFASALG